eukprot:3177620-Pleurochrysis_carterae.AAC.1
MQRDIAAAAVAAAAEMPSTSATARAAADSQPGPSIDTEQPGTSTGTPVRHQPHSLAELRTDLRDAAHFCDGDNTDNTPFFSAATLMPTMEEEAAHLARRELLVKHFETAYRLGGIQWLKSAAHCRVRLKA